MTAAQMSLTKPSLPEDEDFSVLLKALEGRRDRTDLPVQKGAVVFGAVPKGCGEEQGFHMQEEMQLWN